MKAGRGNSKRLNDERVSVSRLILKPKFDFAIKKANELIPDEIPIGEFIETVKSILIDNLKNQNREPIKKRELFFKDWIKKELNIKDVDIEWKK